MIEQINKKIEELLPKTLMASLGMTFNIIDNKNIEGTMPVDDRTAQHMGFLHGGASLAFAETLAGIGSHVSCDKGQVAVGMQVSASHLAPVKVGEGVLVYGKAQLIHRGRKSHVWNVDIFDKNDKLISTARVTNSIINPLV